MAYGELYYEFPTVYTDMIAPIQAALVDCGWTQVGVTDIYKSATPNELGFYGYVRIYDSGARLSVEAGCRLNEAGDDFADSITRETDFSTDDGGWMIIVFPWWFYAYSCDATYNSYNDAILTGGLFRAHPGGWFAHCPYYAGGTGTAVDEVVMWELGGSAGYGFRSRRPNNDGAYASRGSGLGARFSSSISFHYRAALPAGGGVISPVHVAGADTIQGTFGYQYNVLSIATWYYGTYYTDSLQNPCQGMTHNGIKYWIPPRFAMWIGQASACMVQRDGF